MPAARRAPDTQRRSRLAAQLLAGRRARSAAAVARRLLAIQAQNLRAARLAVRARTEGLCAADVNQELEDRAVVISWLCRGTLHMVCREDYAWLLGLSAPPQRPANRRRLHQLGYGPDRARSAAVLIERTLAAEGPLTRAAIAERLAVGGFSTEGQAVVHLLFLASLDGRIIRGPFRGAEQAFVCVPDWLGVEAATLSAADRPAALAALGRRYLAGHGPATAADLALWAGLPVRDARAALAGAATHPGRRVGAGKPSVRLLPAFDPFLLGWQDRTYAVPTERHSGVFLGGMIRPVAVADGVAVGTWSSRRRGGRLQVDIESWDDVTADVRAGLDAEAADVARFETR
jgi:hypothetical protein